MRAMFVFISVAGIFGLLLAATDRHAAPGDWLLPACVVTAFAVTYGFGRALAPRTHVNPVIALSMLGGTVGIMLAVVILMSAIGPDIISSNSRPTSSERVLTVSPGMSKRTVATPAVTSTLKARARATGRTTVFSWI